MGWEWVGKGAHSGQEILEGKGLVPDHAGVVSTRGDRQRGLEPGARVLWPFCSQLL